MINVTKTFFPPLNRYHSQLLRIWENEWLTNRGELVLELEKEILEFCSLENTQIIAMNNGTIPIQIALHVLGSFGEIITTPFSYIATSSSILWQNCTPIFVDIDPLHLTIDERKIESLITDKTTCILATHVFGNPCNVEEIKRIADRNNLNVIYDAAHSFGVKYLNKSIFEYGDISTCSFHATKLFHTGEGGALFCNKEEIFQECYSSHNFGHDGPLDFHGIGINGKMSELQAAMGLSVLPYLNEIILSRKLIVDNYQEELGKLPLNFMQLRMGTEWNYSYFPIITNNKSDLKNILERLNKKNIFPRQYFAPSLNTLSFMPQSLDCPVSESISERILCLPLFDSLDRDAQSIIISIIKEYFQ